MTQLDRVGEPEGPQAREEGGCPADQAGAVAYAGKAHSRRDWPEATRRWAEVRARFPDCCEGYVGGGASLTGERRYMEADEVYRWAMGRFPVSAQLLGDFGASALLRQDAAEATRRWVAARTLFPDRAEVVLREARAFRDAGLASAAEILEDEARERFPGRPGTSDTVSRAGQG
jgi:Flp pilus assembly protein TadD